MGDLLVTGLQWLEGMRKQHASEPVTYRRGGQSLELQATRGRRTYELDDGAGGIVTAEVTDFLVAGADLAAFGEPKPGDLIEVDGLRHEVLALGNDACWQPCDPYHLTRRIHTKRIGA
jgi:hypothetical protein